MTEENDATETGGADAIIEHTELVEKTSEATPEQATGTDETGPADDAGEATAEGAEGTEPTKRVPWFQKRIDEVTRQKYDEQRRADYLQGQLDALARGQQPQPAQQSSGPPDRWEEPEAYDQWLIQQATQQFAQQQQRQTLIRSYEERVASARSTKPDFDNVVHNPALPISPLMAEIIRESDAGPEVAYHLGTHPQEAERIYRLPLHRQAAELGKLEATLSKPVSQSNKPIPPAPPSTVGAVSSGLSKPLEEMSMAEYIAARTKGQS